jgi:hypothetical protein
MNDLGKLFLCSSVSSHEREAWDLVPLTICFPVLSFFELLDLVIGYREKVDLKTEFSGLVL